MHIDESKKFDKRTMERNLREGIVSTKEWEKYLESLPDASDNVDFVMIADEQEEETTKDQEGESEEPAEKETAPERE